MHLLVDFIFVWSYRAHILKIAKETWRLAMYMVVLIFVTWREHIVASVIYDNQDKSVSNIFTTSETYSKREKSNVHEEWMYIFYKSTEQIYDVGYTLELHCRANKWNDSSKNSHHNVFQGKMWKVIKSQNRYNSQVLSGTEGIILHGFLNVNCG